MGTQWTVEPDGWGLIEWPRVYRLEQTSRGWLLLLAHCRSSYRPQSGLFTGELAGPLVLTLDNMFGELPSFEALRGALEVIADSGDRSGVASYARVWRGRWHVDVRWANGALVQVPHAAECQEVAS